MAKGSKFWAGSYIVFMNGQKLYLENDFCELSEKMRSKDKRIILNISGFHGKEITVKKAFIIYYGKV